MITEAPGSPGTALPVNHPAASGRSNGGSSTSPSRVSPSRIRGAERSSAGISRRFGTTAGRSGSALRSLREASTSPVTTPAVTTHLNETATGQVPERRLAARTPTAAAPSSTAAVMTTPGPEPSAGPPAAVPPPPARGALVGYVVAGAGVGRRMVSVAVPVSLVASQRTSTRYRPGSASALMSAVPVSSGTAGVAVDAGGRSETRPVNASERTIARYSVPPLGSGQRAVIRTLFVSPPVSRDGRSPTGTSWRAAVCSGEGVAGAAGVEPAVSAAAEHPSGASSRAPAAATRASLITGHPSWPVRPLRINANLWRLIVYGQ